VGDGSGHVGLVVHVVVDGKAEVGLAGGVPRARVHLVGVVGEAREVERVVGAVVPAHLGGRLGVLLVDDAAPAEGDAVVYIVDIVAVLWAAGVLVVVGVFIEVAGSTVGAAG